MEEAINIVLDDNEPPNVFFVEIELDDGRSVNIGERMESDGLTRLRITAGDIINANTRLAEIVSALKS